MCVKQIYKRVWFLVLIFVVSVLAIILVRRMMASVGSVIPDIETCSVEVLTDDEKSVKTFEMNEDVQKMQELFQGEELFSDNGVVFAEGKYRIVLETSGGTIYLYPYCGDPSGLYLVEMKGNEGNVYLMFDETEKASELEELLNRYFPVRENGGISDWSKLGG